MATHRLKTDHEVFLAVQSGDKMFELRYDDRGYEVGDTLELLDWDAQNQVYLGPVVRRRVTYILRPEEYISSLSRPSGWCIMSLAPV